MGKATAMARLAFAGLRRAREAIMMDTQQAQASLGLTQCARKGNSAMSAAKKSTPCGLALVRMRTTSTATTAGILGRLLSIGVSGGSLIRFISGASLLCCVLSHTHTSVYI
mmetsp:Transcript_107485/g.195504  ORF Transcript_107485/g.195504 Transcript_107485/m.195504 type:complete len:111 (+) Transcript_107485:610-942(+)